MLFLLHLTFYYTIHSHFYVLGSPSFLNIYSLFLLIYNSTYISCILLNPDLPLTCLSISIIEFSSWFEMPLFLFHFPRSLPFSSIFS